MKILVFGKGGLSDAIARYMGGLGHRVVEIPQIEVDVTDYMAVVAEVERHEPNAVVNCAGLSDRLIGIRAKEVVAVNLTGAINVGTAADAFDIPCLLVASTAGIVPGDHAWYGAAKAGVITYVRSMASQGARIWALSPGRMNTPMRQADFPDEDVRTRLDPLDVSVVIEDIFDGLYAPGANVVVRKVGLERIDVYEDMAPTMPSMGL